MGLPPPTDEAERAPLQANGGSNGNGEVRQLDNGHAVIPSENINMREFNAAQGSDELVVSPRQHNILERIRKVLPFRVRNSTSTANHQATVEA